MKKPRCIYCDSQELKSFKTKAHVISQLMGNFGDSDLFFEGDVVCDKCNSEFGKSFEKQFARKSFEGVIARLHLRRKRKNQTAVILYDSSILKFHFSTETLLGYDPLLLLVKSIVKKVGVVKDPLILLKKGNLYAFIFAKDVDNTTGQNAINKLQSKINNFKEGTEYGEWIGDSDGSSIIIKSALTKLGLKANFNEEKINPKPKPINMSFTATQEIDKDIARFVAKVAFEYFVYCTKSSGVLHQVFSEELKPILDFIREGKGDARNFVSLVSNKFAKKPSEQTNDYYFITFEVIKGFLVGTVSFMDSIGYRVKFGKSPFRFENNRIGGAHAFNLERKTLQKLYNSNIPIINPGEFNIYRKS